MFRPRSFDSFRPSRRNEENTDEKTNFDCLPLLFDARLDEHYHRRTKKRVERGPQTGAESADADFDADAGDAGALDDAG